MESDEWESNYYFRSRKKVNYSTLLETNSCNSYSSWRILRGNKEAKRGKRCHRVFHEVARIETAIYRGLNDDCAVS